jgi:thioredoxin 1
MISPHFAKLEAKFPAIKFAKVDVEEQDVSLPSFLASVS